MTESLASLSETEFARHVNAALKNYGSLLELSRSPLAAVSLIGPAIVLDEANPTADDRGRALRVILRWAVNRLAPSPPRYPLGVPRPYDDPTWMDPLWWRYTILRHRYIEPMRPDDLEERGLIDMLLSLTGIPGAERLSDERNRAVREVAFLLLEQIRTHQADVELLRIAVEDYVQETPRPAQDVLGLAATFRWVFPRALLLEMAAAERLSGVSAALDYAVSQRLLLAGDGGANLLMPSALQVYLHARQSSANLNQRHMRAAKFYTEQFNPIRVAWHLYLGRQPIEAADILLEAAEALIAEGQIEELREALTGFIEGQVPSDRWHALQLCLGDLCQRIGNRDEALAAYRRALKAAREPSQQAHLYRRLGKLYEDDNQIRALGYYQQAAERLASEDIEWLDLLKDRGWLHIIRREWAEAEADLTRALSMAERLALEQAPASAKRQRADVCHALASLYRRQVQYERAIAFAQQALSLREEVGDLQRVADSCSSLGLIYDEMGEHRQALKAYEESLAVFGQVGDREGVANANLNIGASLYGLERFREAADHYRESLEIFQAIGLPRAEAQAHQNLAEAFAAMGQVEEARRHWNEGYLLSQRVGLDDQLDEFRLLRDRTPALQSLDAPVSPESRRQDSDLASVAPASWQPVDQMALEIARRSGRVTAKMLMERSQISKPTATRCLSDLARRGLLIRAGKGRASYYVLPAQS